MPIQALGPQRLYRQIAEQLRTLIGKGEFAPGARLPAERDLAKQLGVSRPSVREALIALEVEGWVEVRTGSGVYVQDRSSTYTPEPVRTSTQLSTSSAISASRTDGRLTPSCWARSRSAGRRSPAANSPLAMSARNCSAICRYRRCGSIDCSGTGSVRE